MRSQPRASYGTGRQYFEVPVDSGLWPSPCGRQSAAPIPSYPPFAALRSDGGAQVAVGEGRESVVAGRRRRCPCAASRVQVTGRGRQYFEVPVDSGLCCASVGGWRDRSRFRAAETACAASHVQVTGRGGGPSCFILRLGCIRFHHGPFVHAAILATPRRRSGKAASPLFPGATTVPAHHPPRGAGSPLEGCVQPHTRGL